MRLLLTDTGDSDPRLTVRLSEQELIHLKACDPEEIGIENSIIIWREGTVAIKRLTVRVAKLMEKKGDRGPEGKENFEPLGR